MASDGLVGRRLGGFEIIEPLGHGGFATVYRARQVRLGRDVALKVLDPLLARNADAARRFEREGLAAAGLDHPCVVPVYEAGEEHGMWYLAMRLVEGSSLADELSGSVPAPDRVVAIVQAVGAALDHAHGRGVLHRDVKPANILVDDNGIWLADFGIAATAQQAGLYTLGPIGTLQYMAPEQARPGEGDHRSDLYSLGCVAYECLTSSPPFVRPDLAGLLYAHAHDPVPTAGNDALDAFFARALAKDPADRFRSGADLAVALAAALGVDAPATPATPAPPTTPRPAPPPVPGAPPPPRRPLVPRAAAAVLVFVVAPVAAFFVARALRDPGPAPSPTTVPTTAPPTTGDRTASDHDRIRTFLTAFESAERAGDAATLTDAMHPAVIARYGRAQCEAGSREADPTAAVDLIAFTSGPERHEYFLDGQSVVVERTYAVAVTRTVRGRPLDTTFHLAVDDAGTVTWFTDCGTPVPTTTA